MNNIEESRGSVATGIVSALEPGPEVRELGVFIGNWINEGYLVEGGVPGGRSSPATSTNGRPEASS
jgi:hypothetical protein